jgi:hypothetical protein
MADMGALSIKRAHVVFGEARNLEVVGEVHHGRADHRDPYNLSAARQAARVSNRRHNLILSAPDV